MLESSPPAFDWQPRTRVIFGAGRAADCGALARERGWERVLLVTDPGVWTAGPAQLVAKALADAGLSVTVFREVRENPCTKTVAAALAMAREAQPAAFIAVGGGSSMDCAKGANFLYTNGGQMADFWGYGKAHQPLLPMIAVPTTAGTGSEVQSYALISQADSHRKMACGAPSATPAIAILDPRLTLSLPPRITATAGIDAVTHALEAAVTRTRTPLSMMLAERALALTWPALPRVLANPADLASRGDMLLGACWAGLAIEYSMLGAAHAAANPLTASFDLTHGHAVALNLPAVMAYNAGLPAIAARYAALAQGLGLVGPLASEESAMAALLAGWRDLLRVCDLPGSLQACGVPADALPVLAAQAAQQWTAGHNPRPLGEAEFLSLYQQAWHGQP